MLTLLTQGRTWGPCHLALTFKCLTWASDPWDPKPMHIVLCWWHLHDEIPCLFRSLAIVDALMLMPIATFLSIITDFNLDHPPKRFNQRSSQKTNNHCYMIFFPRKWNVRFHGWFCDVCHVLVALIHRQILCVTRYPHNGPQHHSSDFVFFVEIPARAGSTGTPFVVVL